MKPLKFTLLPVLAAVAAAALVFPHAAAQPLTPDGGDDVEILTRGPVHEAFAEIVVFEPQPGLVIGSAPPEPIEELPPDQRPEGENIAWIPGYWTWDDDRSDFLWVSGVWRNLPPGRQWVPGYWNPIDSGRFQWISGYWADSTVEETVYISTAPPRSVDAGPNVEAPSEDHTWVPGIWVWSETRYIWRPGYWLALRPDWTWVPARYCWTPRGYVYIDGYWDYAIARRGVLFAPVHFHRRVYVTSGFHYRPSIVIGLGVFGHHLFVRPGCGHYYFGDYYAPRYFDAGYHASFLWHSRHRGYDPIWAHLRWHHRHDRTWERRHLADFHHFRDHADARPPRTWAAMRDFQDRFNDGRSRRFAQPFEDAVRAPDPGLRFVALERNLRDRVATQRREVHDLARTRRELETRRPGLAVADRQPANREILRRSPLIGRSPERIAAKDAPPRKPEARGPVIRPPQGATGPNDTPPRVRSGNDGPLPNRGEAADRGRPNRPNVIPSRPEVRPDPSRPPQAAPGRVPQRPEVTPQRRPEATPQRPVPQRPEVRPNPPSRPQATPQTPTPPRPQQTRPTPPQRPQAAPQRPAPRQPQVRPAPQPPPRATPPRPQQVRPAPPARPQAVPQRQVPRQPQVRPAPQPRPQATPQRPAPQRPQQARPTPPQRPQAAPQRQAPQRATPPGQSRPEPNERRGRGR